MLHSPLSNTEIAVFGGGCFWCTEAIFQRLNGVIYVTSGYAGGQMPNPGYEDVSTGTTGHAEVIKIEYNPGQISYSDLLNIFFATHDPTTPNRQGADVGTQYHSVIFYTTPDQKQTAEAKIQPGFTTLILPLDKFYPAEAYHQNYYNSHPDKPYCRLVIAPKLKEFLSRYGTKVSA